MADQNIKIAISALDQTRAAFASVNSNLAGLQNKLDKVRTALGAIFVGAGLVNFAKNTVKLADDLQDTADRLGVTTEFLQRYRFAAQQSGVDTEKFDKGLGKLGKAIGEANLTGGESGKIFKQLGVSITDANGKTKPLAKIFVETQAKLSGISDSSTRAAISMKLFGKEGAQMGLMAKDGVEAMNALAMSLENVITEDSIKKAQQLDDQMKILGLTVMTPVREAFLQLTPQILAVANTFGNFLAVIARFVQLHPQITAAAVAITALAVAIRLLGAPITIFVGLILGAIAVWDKFFNKVEEKKGLLDDIFGGAATETKVLTEAQIKLLEDGVTPLDKALKSLEKTEQDLKAIQGQIGSAKYAEALSIAQRSAFGLTNELDNLYQKKKLIQAAFDKDIIQLPEYTRLMKDLTIAQMDYKISIGDASIYDGAKAGAEDYFKSVSNNAKIAREFVSGAFKKMEDALVNFAMGTATAKDAFKQFASSIIQDLIRIQMQKMITQPLSNAISSIDFSSIFSGARASGGTVTGGNAYMVGEQGAEMFVPNKTGTIVPNNALSGTGTTINQTIQISAGVSQTVRTEIMSMMPRIMEATKAAVADSKRRGGTYGNMMA